jgi:deazaflavin-dependent oxidoreductase (nitroreductase family)
VAVGAIGVFGGAEDQRPIEATFSSLSPTLRQLRNTPASGSVPWRMDTKIQSVLDDGGIIDITTIGARSGVPRRIEINFVQLAGSYYITGRPGRRRDWLANMKANPDFKVHLKHGVTADLSATAEEITDDDERADVLYRILTESWGNEPARARHLLPRWVEGAPLVGFTLTR